MLPRILMTVCLVLGTTSVATSQEVVDEIVAVVDTSPILASDLDLAHLVDLAPKADLLSARIALELQFRELVDSGNLYRLEIDVRSVHAELQRRIDVPASDQSPLVAFGLTDEDTSRLALRIAARDAFVEQRLRPRVRVTLDDLREAYQDEVVATLAEANVPVPPIEDVTSQLRDVLMERRLTEEIEDWMGGLASRHEVIRFR